MVATLLARKKVAGKLLAWSYDFLKDRQMRVKYQGTFSDYSTLQNGTPQGSVLSPYLFNILMDYLLQTTTPQNVEILSYADDIAIIATGPNAFANIQEALNSVASAIDKLGLKISLTKTTAITFLYPDPRRHLKINDSAIPWVHEYPYLGIIIDKHLTFQQHVSALHSRISKRLNFMRALSARHHGANSHVLRLFYTASIRSILDYSAPALMVVETNQIDRLNKLQNCAMRIILGAPGWTNICNLQQETSLLPISHRINYIATSFIISVLHQTDSLLYLQLNNNRLYPNRPQYSWIKHAAKLRHELLPHLHGLQDQLLDPPPPPWQQSPAFFDIHLPPGGKLNASPHVLRNLAQERIAQLNQNKDAIFFTDGSVVHEPQRAGAGIVLRSQTNSTDISIRTSDHASSLQAELVAISAALTSTDTGNYKDIIVHTDSLSAIQVLQNHTPSENLELVSLIQRQIRTISSRNGSTTFHWIPSHVGIPLNEKADALALSATQKENINVNIKQSRSQLKRIAARKLSQDFNTFVTQASRLSHSIQWRTSSTQNLPKQLSSRLPRHIEVRIYRLRLGYRCSWEISHRSNRQCDICANDTSHPLLHYILQCPSSTFFGVPLINFDDETEDNLESEAAHRINNALRNLTAVAQHVQRYPPPR